MLGASRDVAIQDARTGVGSADPELGPPLVSVVIPTYRRPDLLQATITSLRTHLGWPNTEYIVSDDGSPQRDRRALASLPVDRVLCSRRNQGLGASVNRALAVAQGKYILQVQDDWILKPAEGLVYASIACLERHPEVGLIRYYGIECFPEFTEHELNGSLLYRIVHPSPVNLAASRFLYSDTPHMKRDGLHLQLGLYRERVRMELTEADFRDRFLRGSSCHVAYFPAYAGTFSHMGEARSWRTRRMRYRISRLLSKAAAGRALIAAWRWARGGERMD